MIYLKLFEGFESKLYKEINIGDRNGYAAATITETNKGVDIQPGLINKLNRINFISKHDFDVHDWTPAWSLTPNCNFLINNESDTELDSIHIIYEIEDEYYIVKIFVHEFTLFNDFKAYPDTTVKNRKIEVHHYYIVDGWDGMMQLFNDLKLIKKDI